MIDIQADFRILYNAIQSSDVGFCITTNGYVKKDGEAVMGRGIAKQCAEICPYLPSALGQLIAEKGNRVHSLFHRLISFPVKPRAGTSDGKNVVSHMKNHYPFGSDVPGWAMKANLAVISRSLRQLFELKEHAGLQAVILPRPGCGAGELDWLHEVKPILKDMPDWLIVIHI